LTIPPGTELTFGLTLKDAEETGKALVVAAALRQSSGESSGSFH
jgi:hypothetical protein